jgi:hypothetical protein
MRKAVIMARITFLILAVVFLGLAISCGGGRKSSNVLPGIDNNTNSSTSSYVDRTASVPESDIGKLDPRVQALYRDPGWEQPITPQAQSETPPAPPELTVERLFADAQAERIDRNAEPVNVAKGSSFLFRPPTDPNYFPTAGEYDPAVYPGSPPATIPPWGSDDPADGDRLEDRIQRVDQFNRIARSFVWRGETVGNQFNRGYPINNSLAAVYQTYRDVDGNWGEWSYPITRPYNVDPFAAFDVAGMIYAKLQLATKVRRFSQLENFTWYSILIAPLGAMSAEYTATGAPNGTKANYQDFYYDSTAMPYGKAWMVKLNSSTEPTITTLINTQSAASPAATFPIFGTIFQRWADDVWNVGVDDPWTGRLGWPLGEPFIDRAGRIITGPNGQYYRYGQYFEKGYMWLYDYILPNVPDEVYIYMYDKNSTLISGGTYTQDPTVVKCICQPAFGECWRPDLLQGVPLRRPANQRQRI